MRMDLPGDPSPTTAFDCPDDVLTVDSPRAVMFALDEIQAFRHRFWADHRHGVEPRSHHLRRPREHPDRGHQPSVRPSIGIEEVFEFLAVDVTAATAVGAYGEAVDSGDDGQ
jgi:hypothetical protein